MDLEKSFLFGTKDEKKNSTTIYRHISPSASPLQIREITWSTTQPPFRVYFERWYGLAVIALLNMSIILCCFSFAPIANTSADYFDVSLMAINILATEYMLVYIIIPPFSNSILNKYGVKQALLIGAILNGVGATVRYTAIRSNNNSTRFALVITGQTICAMANPFVQITSTRYAMSWFNDKERTMATMIASIASPVGGAISFFIVPLLGTFDNRVPAVLLVSAVIALILILPIILMHDKPKTPPSYAALSLTEKSIPGVKKLIKDKNFLILLFSFSTINGFRTAILGLLSVTFVLYGYTEKDAGNVGAIMIMSGILGAGIVSYIIDKFHVHQFVLKTAAPLIGISFFMLIFVVKENNFYVIGAICCAIGFLHLSLIPIFLELGVECSYPISANTSTTLLYTGSGLFGTMATLVMDYFRDQKQEKSLKMTKSLWFEGIFVLVAGFLVLFYNAPDLRWQAEATKKRQEKELANAQFRTGSIKQRTIRAMSVDAVELF
ncbi:hypothetical protein G9A89_009423 [Geosiphon pyriformis]|nr:hypothetical protein G9A89_009423 [Geosiphon pyriformis]